MAERLRLRLAGVNNGPGFLFFSGTPHFGNFGRVLNSGARRFELVISRTCAGECRVAGVPAGMTKSQKPNGQGRPEEPRTNRRDGCAFRAESDGSSGRLLGSRVFMAQMVWLALGREDTNGVYSFSAGVKGSPETTFRTRRARRLRKVRRGKGEGRLQGFWASSLPRAAQGARFIFR